MTDEQGVATPEETAPAQEIAETPEVATEATTEEEAPQADEKTFTQTELNAIVQKEKAKADARAERRALKVYSEKLEAMQVKSQHAPAATPVSGKPQLASFENVEDYVEAVADWKLDQRDQGTKQSKEAQQQEATRTKVQGIFAEAEKVEGFDREAFDELPVSDAMAFAIMDSDIAPKLVVHFTNNPKEAERIASLSPARQAAEIGKLEVKLSVAEQKVKASSAPAPIKPLGNRGGAVNKSIESMTMAEFAAHERARGARWAKRG